MKLREKIIAAIIVLTVVFCGGVFVGERRDAKTTLDVTEYIYESPLSDWQVMELAIYKTESEFNALAVGKAGDWGLAQITPIYVEEVNRILGDARYTHEDAFNPQKTHEMLTIMQNHHNPLHDIDRAIASHNPTASSAYSVKVRRNMEWVKNYEEIRKNIR